MTSAFERPEDWGYSRRRYYRRREPKQLSREEQDEKDMREDPDFEVEEKPKKSTTRKTTAPKRVAVRKKTTTTTTTRRSTRKRKVSEEEEAEEAEEEEQVEKRRAKRRKTAATKSGGKTTRSAKQKKTEEAEEEEKEEEEEEENEEENEDNDPMNDEGEKEAEKQEELPSGYDTGSYFDFMDDYTFLNIVSNLRLIDLVRCLLVCRRWYQCLNDNRVMQDINKRFHEQKIHVNLVGNRWFVTGDTYKYRKMLKAKGGKWNPQKKAWVFPDTKDMSAIESLSIANATADIDWKALAEARYSTRCSHCKVNPANWDINKKKWEYGQYKRVFYELFENAKKLCTVCARYIPTTDALKKYYLETQDLDGLRFARLKIHNSHVVYCENDIKKRTAFKYGLKHDAETGDIEDSKDRTWEEVILAGRNRKKLITKEFSDWLKSNQTELVSLRRGTLRSGEQRNEDD